MRGGTAGVGTDTTRSRRARGRGCGTPMTGRHSAPPPTGRRRRTPSPYVGPGLVLACAVAALAACGCLLGLALPSANGKAREFRAAAPCAPAGSGNDCLSTALFTVRDVHIGHGRNARYTAELAGPAPGSGRVDFDSPKPLLRRLHPGDTLRGTLWRGRIVTVGSDAYGIRQATSADPAGGPDTIVEAGVTLGAGGVAGLTAGCVMVRRRRAARGAAR